MLSGGAARLLSLSLRAQATWTGVRTSSSSFSSSTTTKPRPPSAAATALDSALKSLARVLHPDTLASHPAAAATNSAAFQTLQVYAAAARGEAGWEDGVPAGAIKFRFRFFMRGGDGDAALVGPVEVSLRPPPPAPGPALAGLRPLLEAAGLRPPELASPASGRPSPSNLHLSPAAAAAEEAALSSRSLSIALPAAVARARRLAALHAAVNLEAARVRAALRLVHGARVSVAGGLGERLRPPERAGLMDRLAGAADAAAAEAGAAAPAVPRPLAGLHIVIGGPGEGGVDATGAVWLPADGGEADWSRALAAAAVGTAGPSSSFSTLVAASARDAAEQAAAASLGVDAVCVPPGCGPTDAYDDALDALLLGGVEGEEGEVVGVGGGHHATWPGVVLELDASPVPSSYLSPLLPGRVRVAVGGLGGEAGVGPAVRRALAADGPAAQAAAAEAAGVEASLATLREAAREALGSRSVSVATGVGPGEAAAGAAALHKVASTGSVRAPGVGVVIGEGGRGVEVGLEGGRVVVGWDCE